MFFTFVPLAVESERVNNTMLNNSNCFICVVMRGLPHVFQSNLFFFSFQQMANFASGNILSFYHFTDWSTCFKTWVFNNGISTRMSTVTAI